MAGGSLLSTPEALSRNVFLAFCPRWFLLPFTACISLLPCLFDLTAMHLWYGEALQLGCNNPLFSGAGQGKCKYFEQGCVLLSSHLLTLILMSIFLLTFSIHALFQPG